MSGEALISAWGDHLRQDRRRSLHTVRAYVATAERLLAFLSVHQGGPPQLDAVEAADLRAFLARRRMEGLGNASAARELSAIRGFLAFASGAEAVPRLKGPRVKKGLPRAISPAEAMSLAEDVADQASDSWIGARDWAILLLLYGAGLRISEALGLTGAVLPLERVLRVTGKRNKTRIVPLLTPVADAINAYVALCPYPATNDQPLFRGSRGGPLNPAIIRRSVRAARTRLGLDPAGPYLLFPADPARAGKRFDRAREVAGDVPLQRICLPEGPTCAACRNCSAMPVSARHRSTRQSMRPICSTYTGTPTPVREPPSGYAPMKDRRTAASGRCGRMASMSLLPAPADQPRHRAPPD